MITKYGRDEEFEAAANKLLADSVGDNKRSVARDAEKMHYEAGRIPRERLEHYDPDNDWDTLDSSFAIPVDPGDIDDIESTMRAEVDDDNVRARNPGLRQRADLMRHVEDTDHWGSTSEDIPLLGINVGPRKTCTRCKLARGLKYFSPDRRNKDGLHSWCKTCRKKFTSQNRNNAT
jgi:hypothetical protein